MELSSSDNRGIRCLLFFLTLKMGDYEAAEEQAERNKDERAVDFHYGRLIVKFVKFNRADIVESDLDRYVVCAMETNPYVADLLMQTNPLPPSPSKITRGIGTSYERGRRLVSQIT